MPVHSCYIIELERMRVLKVEQAVRQETIRIAAGVAVLTVLMIGVFLIIGQFSMPVLWGALLGAVFAVGNFFLMAMAVQRAVNKMDGVHLPPKTEEEEAAEAEDPKAAKQLTPEGKQIRGSIQRSYLLRMLLLGGMAVMAIELPVFDAVAALVPLLFPRIVIFLEGIFLNKENNAQ